MSVLNAKVNMYIMLQVLRREIIKSGEHNVQQPVNLKRLLWNAQRVFDKEQGGKAQSSKATRDVALFWLHPNLPCELQGLLWAVKYLL